MSPSSNRLTTIQTAGTSGTQNNTITYDAAGNTLSNGRYTATYSDRGRLKSVTVPNGTGTATISYLYNGLEQRTRKSGNSAIVPTGAAYYVYDEQGQLLGEYNASGVPIYEVIWLNDLPVGVIKQTRTGSGTTLNVQTQLGYIYADHLNSPRVIARGSPSTDHRIVWRWDSTEPFGVTPANENPNGAGAYSFNLRFPGQVFDKETGLHQNWHRDYESWTGRYPQPDPLGLGAGDVGLYNYAFSQPTRYSDPDGRLVFIPPLAWWGAGLGAAGWAIWMTTPGGKESAANMANALDAAFCPPEPGDKDPCKGLRDQLRDHERKLREYTANPMSMDNKGFLAGALARNDQDLYNKIYMTRLASLQHQIANFKKQLEECERRNGR